MDRTRFLAELATTLTDREDQYGAPRELFAEIARISAPA